MSRRIILLFVMAALLLGSGWALSPAQATTPTPTKTKTPTKVATQAAAPTQQAPTGPTAKVVAYIIRVREADNLKAKLVVAARRNQVLNILGKNAAGTWIKVKTSSGETGWVALGWWVKLAANVKLKDLPVAS